MTPEELLTRSPEEQAQLVRRSLVEDARRSAQRRARRTWWTCLICGGRQVMHQEKRAPRKRNRACQKCRKTRADDVADLRLGLRFE